MSQPPASASPAELADVDSGLRGMDGGTSDGGTSDGGPEAEVQTPAHASRLDKPLVASVAWSAMAKWSAQAATWLSTIVVARVLSAEDFGVVGMASLFMGLVLMLSEMGVGTAIVNLRDLTDEQIARLNGFAIAIGIAAHALTVALAHPLSVFFKTPALSTVLVVLGATFTITGLRSIPNALLQRELRFRHLAIYEATASVVTAVASVCLALAGFGYWALVIGQVVNAVVITALVLRARPQRVAWPRTAVLRTALGFSNRVVVGRFAWYAYSNADFLVAGRLLGTGPLGIYTFGWNLTSLTVDKVAALVNGITPAFFSSVQNDIPALRRMLTGVTEALALVVLPVTMGVALVANDLVPLVFGAKWASAVPVVQLLSVYGVLRALRPVQNNALVVLGHVSDLMWISIGSAIVFPVAFFFASRWGPTGIAAAWTILYPASMAVGFERLFRTGVMTVREYVAAVWPAVCATAVMCVTVLAVYYFLIRTPVRQPVRLAACVVTGALSYTLVLLLAFRERMARFVRLARHVRGGVPSPA
jgi:PST family polysaccharide transporter